MAGSVAAATCLALIPAAGASAGPGASAPTASQRRHRPPTVPGAKAKIIDDGQAVAPAERPAGRSSSVIAAANKIEDKPYKYGGGHGNWNDKGYDCSGAVSYALHGGGLLKTPARLERPRQVRRARQGLVDHRLRRPEPRLHGRRRPPVRHLDDAGQRPRLEQDDALHRRRATRSATPRASRPQADQALSRNGRLRAAVSRFGPGIGVGIQADSAPSVRLPVIARR